MYEFIFKIVDSFFKVLSLCIITFETGSANIFNSIAKVIVEILIADKVPDFYCSACVMAWGLGQCFNRFVSELDSA